MPIGWNAGDGGATYYAPGPGAVFGEEPAPDPAPDETTADGFWTWVEVDAETVYPVVWTRWATAEDERVCPECGPLDGAVWEADDGPASPLHVNCRCQRLYAFTEWRTRPTTTWEQRWIEA